MTRRARALRRTRTRAGFTIVELAFALVITGVLMASLYQILFATTSQSYKIDAKYEALRSAMVVAEVVSREVDRLVTLPVERDGAGKVVPRHGDHVRPVYVGADGRGVSFYVPSQEASGGLAGEPADPLMISLEPAPEAGIYRIRRDQGKAAVEGALARSEAASGEEPDEAAAAVTDETAPGSRAYRGVHIRSLRFRLLSPEAESEGTRSPDDNYYLEAVVVGTDRQGREQSALTVLKPLNFPTERLADPTVPTVKYDPTAPLSPPAVVVNPTPAEKQAADDLVKIADEWADGTLTPEQLVDRAREALKPVSGTVPSGAISSGSPQIPGIPPGSRVVSPPGSPPVIAPPPGTPGPTVVLPPTGGPPAISVTPQGEQVWFTGWGAVLDANGRPIYSTGFEGGGTMGGQGGSTWEGLMGQMRGQMGDIQQTLVGVSQDYLRTQQGGS